MLSKKTRANIPLVLFLLLVGNTLLGVRVPCLFADKTQKTDINEDESDTVKNKSSQAHQFTELLLQVRQSDSGETLWDAIKNVPFVFSSDSINPSFHFEYSKYAPRFVPSIGKHVKVFSRLLMECQGSQNSAIVFNGQVTSPMSYLNENGYLSCKNHSTYQLFRDKRWGYIFDQKHLSEPFDSNYAPKEFTGFLLLDLPSRLDGMMSGTIPSVQWESISHTLVLTKANGTRIQLRFHSPSDANRYGTNLAEVRARGSHGGIECFRSFQTAPCLRTRLPSNEIQFVESKLKPVFKEDFKPGKEVQFIPEKMWYATTSFHPFGESVDFQEIKDYQDLNARERLVFLVDSFVESSEASLLNPEKTKYLPLEKLDKDYLTAVVEQFRFMTIWVAHNTRNEGVYPDDPAMIWREMEAAFGPDDTTNIIYSGLKYILYESSTSERLKIAFLDALGDWGFPPFLDNERTWNLKTRIQGDPFYEAILWSHWQWPCEQKHVEACVRASRISENGSEIERVATETLIRLNAIPLVLKKVMERWYQSQVAQAGPAERRINLSVLSLQPTGRSYLLNRLKTKVDTVGIQSDIAKVLQLRAQATLKTKRFDFMTENKCNKILAVTEPILASAN